MGDLHHVCGADNYLMCSNDWQ